MKGNLINIINNTLEKKPENIDAQLIGPSLNELLPDLEFNDWMVADNEIYERPLDCNSNKNQPKNKKPIWLDIFNFNIISRIEKNEYFS